VAPRPASANFPQVASCAVSQGVAPSMASSNSMSPRICARRLGDSGIATWVLVDYRLMRITCMWVMMVLVGLCNAASWEQEKGDSGMYQPGKRGLWHVPAKKKGTLACTRRAAHRRASRMASRRRACGTGLASACSLTTSLSVPRQGCARHPNGSHSVRSHQALVAGTCRSRVEPPMYPESM
jgi:hypothetical protein